MRDLNRTLEFANLNPRARRLAYRLCAECKLASWRTRGIPAEGRETAIWRTVRKKTDGKAMRDREDAEIEVEGEAVRLV